MMNFLFAEVISIASDYSFGCVLHVLAHLSEITSLCFSPSNKYLLIMARKSWQHVLDLDTGQKLDLTHSHNMTNKMAASYVNSVKWSSFPGGGIIFGYNNTRFCRARISYLTHLLLWTANHRMPISEDEVRSLPRP